MWQCPGQRVGSLKIMLTPVSLKEPLPLFPLEGSELADLASCGLAPVSERGSPSPQELRPLSNERGQPFCWGGDQCAASWAQANGRSF